MTSSRRLTHNCPLLVGQTAEKRAFGEYTYLPANGKQDDKIDSFGQLGYIDGSYGLSQHREPIMLAEPIRALTILEDVGMKIESEKVLSIFTAD